MSSRLGPLEVECDAPPYSVVCACRDLGLQSPEDVRWRRLSRFWLQWKERRGLFGIGSWAELAGPERGARNDLLFRAATRCLPLYLEAGSFLFGSGKTQTYPTRPMPSLPHHASGKRDDTSRKPVAFSRPKSPSYTRIKCIDPQPPPAAPEPKPPERQNVSKGGEW